MIAGRVRGNEPIVVLTLRDLQGLEQRIEAVIDTGSAFPLTLPSDLIEEFGFGHLRYPIIELADQTERAVPALDVQVVEFGPLICLAVLLPGKPLLGMGLLKSHRLTVEAVEGGRVLIEPLPRSTGSYE